MNEKIELKTIRRVTFYPVKPVKDDVITELVLLSLVT